MRSPPSQALPRRITLLGATGSVGGSTLALVRERPDHYRVEAVTAHRNARSLAAIARETGAAFAAVADPAAWPELREHLAGTGIEAAAGPEAVIEAAARPAEWVLASIVGAAGLAPTMEAVGRGAMVALANKEALVCAGPLLMAAVARHGATLLPVDSEHNAIYQALGGADPAEVERIILTASGGPFRARSRDAMARVTPEEAVAHPNWSMGAKISVDSATMMNKGLEVIEAHFLFGLDEALIEVLVHPQSTVHGLVAFRDGSFVAQLGAADMRIPIAHTLAWPARATTRAPRLDLARLSRLDFEPPDPERFPALALARAALRAGGAAPTILNAANEVAVAAFLARQLSFLEIAEVAAEVLDRLPAAAPVRIDDVVACDGEARTVASRVIAELNSARPSRIEAS